MGFMKGIQSYVRRVTSYKHFSKQSQEKNFSRPAQSAARLFMNRIAPTFAAPSAVLGEDTNKRHDPPSLRFAGQPYNVDNHTPRGTELCIIYWPTTSLPTTLNGAQSSEQPIWSWPGRLLIAANSCWAVRWAIPSQEPCCCFPPIRPRFQRPLPKRIPMF